MSEDSVKRSSWSSRDEHVLPELHQLGQRVGRAMVQLAQKSNHSDQEESVRNAVLRVLLDRASGL